jgi:AcrR family transcriptional regulator
MAVDQRLEGKATERRRATLRVALVAAAERAIAREGLAGLRARAVAEEAGCAVGAIYNIVQDLDDLVLLVNAKTLDALKGSLEKTFNAPKAAPGLDDAIERLVQMALAYLDFAAANRFRWRALFDHRLPPGHAVPERYRNQHLFEDVEKLLVEPRAHESRVRRALLARSLFSAVHGLVVLGLDEKLQPIPLPVLREQIRFVVTAIGRGMVAST